VKSETKQCQNCKQDFVIEPDDFSFYEKIKVPPPTFCPECRMMRRMSWRNERALYRRSCSLCKKDTIAIYNETVPFPVYCRECWYSDKWDPTSYGIAYDASIPFFEQYKKLSEKVPRLALWQRNAINSDYSNMCGECKNVYLSVSVVKGSENVFYSKCIDSSKDIVDSLNVINGSESLYENVEAQNNYNSQYLLLCSSCVDSYYLVDCMNCSDCFMCSNLRNKKFCINNQQYSKEDYFEEIKKFNLGSRISREALKKEFEEIKKNAIFRFGNITRAVNSTGNNVLNVKNCKNCFEIYNVENASYCYRAFDFKDCMDFNYGQKSELLYEYTTGALNNYNVKFSYSAMDSVKDSDYTDSCRNCSNLFGCISLNNVKNAILNKIYSDKEYNSLRDEIIRQMSTVPFINKKGIKYEYGEFFPVEISPWAYNESLAQEFFPLTKEEIKDNGYNWYDQNTKNFKITMPAEKIPDNIDDVNEEILKEVLGCAHKGDCDHQCNIAFRLTDYEFKFYKKHNIPLPILCPNCRHYERYKVMPALRLWKRNCMCNKENHQHKEKCKIEFETAYAPDRPEIIYCKRCYQQEVY
jgi:hypothetical protein